MRCYICHIFKAIRDPYYGYLPCEQCLLKSRKLKKPGRSIEFTSCEIKEQRKEYKKDIEPMHYKGELNKRWLDTYGKEKALQHGFSEYEIKHAKYANIDNYYKD